MELQLFSSCIVIFLIVMLYGLRTSSGVLQYPVLASLVFLLWIMPQGYSVWVQGDSPEGSIERLFGTSALCVAAIGYGFHKGGLMKMDLAKSLPTSSITFFIFGSLLFGGLFTYLLRGMDQADRLQGETGFYGVSVAYFFLSKPLQFGSFLSLAVFLRTKNQSFLWYALPGLLYCIYSAIVYGRRGPLLEFTLATLCLLFFIKGILIPRIAFLSSAILATLFINGAGIYRAAVFEGYNYGEDLPLNEVLNRVGKGVSAVSDQYVQLLLPERCPEVTNAVMYMEAASVGEVIDFGTDVSDYLVQDFIPRQIVGSDFKNTLKWNIASNIHRYTTHRGEIGATTTGLTDAFISFRWFGFIKFMAIAWLLGFIWNNACRGDFIFQLCYACVVKDGLESITHSTPRFFASVIVFLIFCGFWLYVICRKEQTNLQVLE